MTTTEIRTGREAVVEFRASTSGPGTLAGYAAVFNRLSQNLGGFVEQVDPAAFNKSLADGVRVLARYNHEDQFLLGTTDGGSLVLEVDGTGLRYTVELPDTTAGRDVAVLAARGDVRFSSFAFRTLDDEWTLSDQEFPLRTLKSVQLVDVAPVNTPAYMDTSAGMRSLTDRLGIPAGTALPDLAEIRSALKVTTTDAQDGAPTDEAGDRIEQGQGETHPLLDAARLRHELLRHTL